MDYIIVQAGGKGTRLKYLTENKPKALVPIDNLPMIFHLFRKYPSKRFIIIADYKKEVLREYLSCFADVKYQIVDASGTGTCSGISQSMDLIPNNVPFMLVWSDLILPEKLALPAEYENTEGKPVKDYVGISSTFPCRWSYAENRFYEERSSEHGVAGFFLFHEKSVIADVPESGELVRWMCEKGLRFEEISLAGTREFGLLEEYEKLETVKCRPFNRILITEDHATGSKVLIKEPVDAQGEKLAKREIAWYQKAGQLDIDILPKIYETNPLKMEYIEGRNIYDCSFGESEKRRILKSLIDALKKLHAAETVPADTFSLKEAYYNKTMDRIGKIQDLVPFATDPYIVVNGRKCRNVFFYKRELEKKLEELNNTCEDFAFIHGDNTFSNMMVRMNGEPVLIDPRGYFGFMELYGDIRYDWAKLYYSIVGNYDRFNLKRFRLRIEEPSAFDNDKAGRVTLNIESEGWEDMERDFFELTGADPKEIKLLHAVIWLSLTTYAWQDFDSICGAFYNGIYYLEEVW